MSRTVFFSLLMLLSGKAIFADGHHHDKKDTVVILENTKDRPLLDLRDHRKKDTVVIVENQKDNHHHHCEEKRSLKALCCQFTRNYIREGLTVVAAAGAYCIGQGRSDQLPTTLVAGCIGFTVGHVFKKVTKLTMYLNNIPKN